MTATLKNRREDWDSTFGPEDYLVTTDGDGKLLLRFLCPGCGKLIGVSKPPWEVVDIETLTARASILHSKEWGGCGWHGYLTDGKLEPC